MSTDAYGIPLCTCGHALSSHRQDPDEVWATERCKTCGCDAYDEGRPSDSDDDEEPPE